MERIKNNWNSTINKLELHLSTSSTRIERAQEWKFEPFKTGVTEIDEGP